MSLHVNLKSIVYQTLLASAHIIIIIMDNFCIALSFIRNELTALSRVVSFEAVMGATANHWTSDTTLLYRSTFILLSVKCTLGLFVFPYSTYF